MFFLTFAAVPLYKLFCQVTGYGGTPKIVDIKDQIDISQKKIKIEFNSDVNKKLNWSFLKKFYKRPTPPPLVCRNLVRCFKKH